MLIMVPVACSMPAELEGTWSGYETGRPHRDWTLTIERNQFTLVCENASIWYKGRLKLNSNGKRNKMDLIIRETPVRSCNGKTSFGIYEIVDGSLMLVTAEPGKTQRPFSYDESEGAIVYVFEKSKVK